MGGWICWHDNNAGYVHGKKVHANKEVQDWMAERQWFGGCARWE